MDILTINDRPETYAQSCYYTAAASDHVYPRASGAQRCDVVIIGGGFTGLSTALHLAKSGADVILLEANRVGWGASGRNGGQIHIGQRTDQMTLEKTVGQDAAKALWDLGQKASILQKSLIGQHQIDCDLENGLIHAALDQREADHEHDYAEHLSKHYNYDSAVPLNKAALEKELASTIYSGGLYWTQGGHLHPLKYANGLAKAAAAAGAKIKERSRVTHIEGTVVKTDLADITAKAVVVATNGYHNDLSPRASRFIMPINNYIATTEPLGEDAIRALFASRAAVSDSNFVVNYYRPTADHRLLFGGGENYRYKFPKDIAGIVRKRMSTVFPQLANAQLDHAWGGTLGITVSRMPFFHREKSVFTVGGFSGQGVCLTTLAGKITADAINGNTADFDAYATLPHSAFPGGATLRWPLLALALSWYALRDRF